MNDFLTTWVTPFYRKLLNGNFVKITRNSEREAFNQSVVSVLAVLDEDIVMRLLASSSSWRERLTGSWFCGLKNWGQYIEHIGTLLQKSELVYAGQGYAFALACFADEKSTKYLVGYLDRYLPQTEKIYDQDWAMCALLWLDHQNGTQLSEPYVRKNGLWHQFVSNKEGWNLDAQKEHFWRIMGSCQDKF